MNKDFRYENTSRRRKQTTRECMLVVKNAEAGCASCCAKKAVELALGKSLMVLWVSAKPAVESRVEKKPFGIVVRYFFFYSY